MPGRENYYLELIMIAWLWNCSLWTANDWNWREGEGG